MGYPSKDEGSRALRRRRSGGRTAGVFLGRVLTEYASWPRVFFINLPLAIAVLVLTPLERWRIFLPPI